MRKYYADFTHCKNIGTRFRFYVDIVIHLFVAIANTFFVGASLGGSRMTISHDSFLERALFINAVASSLKNDILSGSILLRATFSSASSKAGSDVSTPNNDVEIIRHFNIYAVF